MSEAVQGDAVVTKRRLSRKLGRNWKFDRLGRNTHNMPELIETLRRYGRRPSLHH